MPIVFLNFLRNILIYSSNNRKRNGFTLGLNTSGDDCGFIQEPCYHRHLGKRDKKINNHLCSFDNLWKKKTGKNEVFETVFEINTKQGLVLFF